MDNIRIVASQKFEDWIRDKQIPFIQSDDFCGYFVRTDKKNLVVAVNLDGSVFIVENGKSKHRNKVTRSDYHYVKKLHKYGFIEIEMGGEVFEQFPREIQINNDVITVQGNLFNGGI